MIRYALICADCEAEFEAWFASSSAYDTQAKAGLIECVSCGGHKITKQIMAPAVRTSGQKSTPPKSRPPCPEMHVPEQTVSEQTGPAKLMEATRKHIAETFEYTGNQFPEEARAIYYGETEQRPIWGEATPQEAKVLHEEGIGVLPLPAKLAPKPPKDKSKLN